MKPVHASAKSVIGAVLLCTGCVGWCGESALSSTSTGEADVSDELFTNSAVRQIEIEISDKGMAELRRYRWHRGTDRDDRPKVPATVREGSRVYTNVSVHLKGSAGSFRPIDSKPGLTLNFDRLAKGQRFHGLDKLSLNNSLQDPTFINDKLCRELFARAGIPVPRADYATVDLNGRSLGLFVLSEGWDKQFLKRHFKNTKGNLYDLAYSNDIDGSLHVNSGERPEDQSELDALANAAADRDPASRIVRLEKRLDLDRFLIYLALEVMVWDWDGYAMNRNNTRIFHDLDTGRVVFMPHGMDQMFWKADGPIMTGRAGILSRAVLEAPEGRQRYLEHFTRLRREVFDVTWLTNRVRQLADRIRSSVNSGGLRGLVANAQFDYQVNQLCQRIVQRAYNIDAQLLESKRRLRLQVGESAPLSDWKSRALSGQPTLDQTRDPPALHFRATATSAGDWHTLVWLERGTYRIEGRIRTRGLLPDMNQTLAGVGFRVWSDRKQTDGLDWGWFPYRRSGARETRGELVVPGFRPLRMMATRDWTRVTYEIELREPMADLEVCCDCYADQGEAWFDTGSLRITRIK